MVTSMPVTIIGIIYISMYWISLDVNSDNKTNERNNKNNKTAISVMTT